MNTPVDSPRIFLLDLYKKWAALGDVPTTPCGTWLDEAFEGFPVGTEVEAVGAGRSLPSAN